ncbi:MAG: flippase-like domain-containing protein [Anaerolineales bacterium]|nr:flippase-like domain-containing protein [Anaerolineales bacterium]
MKSIRRRLAAGLVFGFLVLLGLALVGDLRQVGASFVAFNWLLAPFILACTLVNYGLRFLKWHYYLWQIGIRDFSWRESARLFVAGFPLAVTPGKVGEALKGVWLNNKTQIPVARGVTVVLAERISDGLAVLILSTLGVIAYPRYWPVFAIVLGALLAAVLLSQIRPFAMGMLRLAERLPFIRRIAQHLREFYEGAYALFRPRATLTAVALGTFAWLGEGIGMYLVLIGLGVPSGWETLSIAVFVLSFSTVIGAVSALPGGLGAVEVSMTGMLTLLLGLPTSTAATSTLLIRFATLWFGVTLGLAVWTRSQDLLYLQEMGTGAPGHRGN